MKSTTSQNTIICLREMFARFGYPDTIISDNGSQFTSPELKAFIRELGARHVTTAPYHPSSNGLAERFVQSLQKALRKGKSTESLDETLHKFLLTYRNTPHATNKRGPGESDVRSTPAI